MPYFLLIAIPRTGSRMLGDILNSHPGLISRHNYLERPGHDWRADLDKLAQESGKVAVGHCQAKRVTLDMLEAGDAKRLLLVRENYALSALSQLRIEYQPAEGEWFIPLSVFRAEVEFRKEESYRLGREADFLVTYEGLTGPDARNITDSLCDFLGVDRRPLVSRIQKNKPSFPVNWEELQNGS